MTKQAQEAYARGFCKVAESYGVNPEELYKYAIAMNGRAMRQVGDFALNKGKRLWELLTGGSKAIKANYQTARNNLKTLNHLKKVYGEPFLQTYEKRKPFVANAFRDANKAVNQEALKVLAARAGVGAAGVGELALAASGGEAEPPVRRGSLG